jgi:hypothetical protein
MAGQSDRNAGAPPPGSDKLTRRPRDVANGSHDRVLESATAPPWNSGCGRRREEFAQQLVMNRTQINRYLLTTLLPYLVSRYRLIALSSVTTVANQEAYRAHAYPSGCLMMSLSLVRLGIR